VVDPFCGSGTTGRVATRLGRRYAGVDLYANRPEPGARPRRSVRQPVPTGQLGLFEGAA
jgi:hypothetical protein